MLQKTGIVAGAAELNGIQPGNFEEFQEFIIRLDPGFITDRRDHPLDDAGNPGRIKMTQHTDPLVSLLDVEFAQILKTEDGVLDAGISQVGPAQVHPLVGEFRLGRQQRPERGRKGSDPAGGLGAHDPLCRDLHQTQILHHAGVIFREDLIENQGVGPFSGSAAFPGFLQTPAQGKCIFINGHLHHG